MKLIDTFRSKRDTIPSWLFWLSAAATIGLTLLGCWYVMEIPSMIQWDGDFYWQVARPKFIILNLATIGVFWCLLLILFNRVWLANLLCSCVCGCIAIVNYYVIRFHGMPLSFLLLRNFATAMNVLSSYSITLTPDAWKMLAIMLGCILLALAVKFLGAGRKIAISRGYIILRNVVLLMGCFLVVYKGYVCEKSVKPKNTISWSWVEAYSTYGYPACTIETLIQSFSDVSAPDGYTPEKTDTLPTAAEKENAQTPDVVLILNETFFDLNQVADIQTDVPYLAGISALDNLLSGYALSPNAGGGTNNSEYELLSSNSLYLMPGITPFVTLDLTDAKTISSHMGALGYRTSAAHSGASSNYSRSYAYPALQFQNVRFIQDFQELTTYEQRAYATDESVYKNLIRWYEEESMDQPRFHYLLTIQNHGDYDVLPQESDTVHVQNDFGYYTEIINEYLTQIKQSDDAFVELTRYFSQVDRPVIVCMVGDHAPTFAKEIASKSLSEQERNLVTRKVPLLIWANYPLEQQDLGTMSMNYVVPTLLDIAGVQLSPYYSYLLQLKEQVPILTSYGDYYDAQGNRYTYDTDAGAPYEEAVDNYFYLEYENLKKERNQALFQPYGIGE